MATAQTPNTSDTPESAVAGKPHARKVHMVPLADIVRDTRTWPRQEVDLERVKLFVELYTNDADTVPPVELFPYQYANQQKPTYVLVDGCHRFTARQKMHAVSVPAIVRDDIDDLDDAYIEACRSSATSSKPLTSKEKRAAVRRILKTHDSLSDREIARIVGCSHVTVGNQRNTLKRLFSQAGDAITGSGATLERSSPRSIEERAVALFTRPKADAPNVEALTELFREDNEARAAAARWANALATAYNASAVPATPTTARATAGARPS